MRTGLQDSGTVESQMDSMADRIARSFTVGTDKDGYDHHYYRPADAEARDALKRSVREHAQRVQQEVDY